MILLALLFHTLGHKIPLWITGQKMRDIRAKGGLRQIYFEMSGVVFVFSLAFIVLTLGGLTTKEYYVLNENIKYGLLFSQNAKDVGFKDGDKIISINDKIIIEIDDIVEDIKNSTGQIKIELERENRDTIIVLSSKGKHHLIKDDMFFIPRLSADTVVNLPVDMDIVYNQRQRSLINSMAYFPKTIRMIFQLFTPIDVQEGFVLPSSLPFFRRLGYLLIFFGFLNLLPIPGLDFGNTTIALIEETRKKKYNPKRIRNLRYVCIGIISLLIIFVIFYLTI